MENLHELTADVHRCLTGHREVQALRHNLARLQEQVWPGGGPRIRASRKRGGRTARTVQALLVNMFGPLSGQTNPASPARARGNTGKPPFNYKRTIHRSRYTQISYPKETVHAILLEKRYLSIQGPITTKVFQSQIIFQPKSAVIPHWPGWEFCLPGQRAGTSASSTTRCGWLHFSEKDRSQPAHFNPPPQADTLLTRRLAQLGSDVAFLRGAYEALQESSGQHASGLQQGTAG